VTQGSLDLSLVLPCFREEGILEASVREILRTLEDAGIVHEIILVDDASPDGTASRIEAIIGDHPDDSIRSIFHEENQGRGACVTDGFRIARGEMVGYIDVDLETHCRHIPALLQRIKDGADGAVARRLPRVTPRTFYRHVLSRGYNVLVRAILHLPYRDTESGFKFFRREKVLPVLEETLSRGWFWDTEIMALAHGKGLRIDEVDCPFVRREDHPSTVKPLRDSLAYLKALLAFRRRWRRTA
jgi:glycosyltransferase involved in cell wall biosynthesis